MARKHIPTFELYEATFSFISSVHKHGHVYDFRLNLIYEVLQREKGSRGSPKRRCAVLGDPTV